MDNPAELGHIEFCAGYGGIHLGLRGLLPGLRLLALSEIEAYACANLVAKMEAGLVDAAPVWTDVKTFPGEGFRGMVDLLSAGFPCQPFSLAGARAADEDARHLFPYILENIRRMRPGLVLLENVEGIISAKLGGDGWSDPAGTPVLLHVLRELERSGYRCAWGLFSAAEIGASHGRKRVFILGVDDAASGRWRERGAESAWFQGRSNASQPGAALADTGGHERDGSHGESGRGDGLPLADAECPGLRASGERCGESRDVGECGPAPLADATAGGFSQRGGGAGDDGEERAALDGDGGALARAWDGLWPWPPGPGERERWGRLLGVAPWLRPALEAADFAAAESALCGGADGAAAGLDGCGDDAFGPFGWHLHTLSAQRARVDRLRLAGNGCHPATVERAFACLWRELFPTLDDKPNQSQRANTL